MNPALSVLNRTTVKNNFFVEIKLLSATGVPLPEEGVVPHTSIVHQKVNICLYNRALSAYVGNTCRVQASWLPEQHETWQFSAAATTEIGDDIIYLRYAQYDPKNVKTDSELYLLFEFVQHIVPLKQQAASKVTCDIEMSCCYGMIPLKDLASPGLKSVLLEGGEPKKKREFQQELDKQANKKKKKEEDGWFAKLFTKQI